MHIVALLSAIYSHTHLTSATGWPRMLAFEVSISGLGAAWQFKLQALSVVVFIKVHSGFGHEGSSRVIGMIKIRSI